MTKLFISILLMLSFSCFSQTSERGTIKVKRLPVETKRIDSSRFVVETDRFVAETESPLVVVEVMPKFPGGDVEMKKFISKNLKWPKAAKEANVSGIVYMTFKVGLDGSLQNIQVLKGISGGLGCDEEALRIVKLMPKWVPGKQNGSAVTVQYNLPIKFEY